MTRWAMVAALVISGTAFADSEDAPTLTPVVLEVKHASVVSKQDLQFKVVGGCWLAEKTCVDTGQTMEALRRENKRLEKQVQTLPGWVVPVLSAVAVVAFGAGVAVGARLK